MKMPSTKTLAIIGAVAVVAIVVIGKLRSSSSSSTTAAQTTTSDGATGVSVGQLANFESETTSALDAWEQSQGSSASTSTSSSSTSTSSGSSTSALPTTGTVAASNPAPVVGTPGSSASSTPSTYSLAASDGETETISPIAGGTLSTYTSSSGKVVGVIPNPTDGGLDPSLLANAAAAGLTPNGDGAYNNDTGKTVFVSGYGYLPPGETIAQ